MSASVLSVRRLAVASVVLFVGLTTSLIYAPEVSRGGFKPCPQPACEAPCDDSQTLDVLCKTPDGTIVRTTFECCCCGETQSRVNSYRPARGPKPR